MPLPWPTASAATTGRRGMKPLRRFISPEKKVYALTFRGYDPASPQKDRRRGTRTPQG